MRIATALWISLFWLGIHHAWADSPLTSTQFADAYGSNRFVAMASDLEARELSPGLLDTLTNPRVPLPVKLAVVNAVGWEFQESAENARRFLEHVAQDRQMEPRLEPDTFIHFSSEELTVFAYLDALDHYLDDGHLEGLLPLLDAAVAKHAESYGAHLVRTLVEGQLLLGTPDEWPEIWKRYDAFLNNPELKLPLKPKAEKIITDYLKLYQNP